MKSLGLTAEFYFPIADNEGVSLFEERKKFRAFLLTEYGGYTDKGIVHGYWKGEDGKTYQDHNCILSVSSPKLCRYEIELLARRVKNIARQEAVYFTINKEALLTD